MSDDRLHPSQKGTAVDSRSIPPRAADDASRRLRTAKIIAAALLASLLLGLAAVEAVRASLRPFFGLAVLGGARTAFRYGIYLGAAAVIVIIRFLNSGRPRRGAGNSGGLSLRRVFAVSIVSLLLAEIPAGLGLVLFLLGGYNLDFYTLLFVSLVLLFMYFPRASTWEARRASPGRTCPM
ncbi:MAG: hypothetical protein PHI34_09055 [Acidobacteriota bacterium]|nr:hypothetical protein [Acidobacteriota bacterium]